MSWIINSVSPPIATIILYRDRASTTWQDFHDRYYQSNGPRIYQLKQSISNIKQVDLDITTHFTKLQTLCDELTMFRPLTDGASSNYQEQDYVLYFLMGLNESYPQIRSNILMMEPLPPINKVFSLIIQEEKQRPLSNLQLPIAAHVHTNKSFAKKPLLCTHCGLQNHTRDLCYKLHGFPPSWKPKPRDSNSSWTANKPDFQPKYPPKQGIAAAVSNGPPTSTFTTEQYQQLLTYLAISTSRDHCHSFTSFRYTF
ncbi:uncharacterized protein LOC133805514 [Humulus lupulus]|uniref:uncharacterized protein LOC133805514 n=1 Tax=Humulus lupulus TaxID=3486 RepID=UPI002B40A99D|nr:uncharacterized protein LOC133805514 [Humulus lupulus]